MQNRKGNTEMQSFQLQYSRCDTARHCQSLVLISALVLSLFIGVLSESTVDAQTTHSDFAFTEIHSGLGQIAQMNFGPDGRLYVATTGSTATGGIFRFDYDAVTGLSNQTKVSDVGSTSIAFHADSASGNTYMYVTDVPNIFQPGTPEPGVLRRMTDTNGDGAWGGVGDINQEVVTTVPITGQHRLNQIQVLGDSLYVNIGSLTTNGTNESAYNGTIAQIDDLKLLTDTTTSNVAGFTGPFVDGSGNGLADVTPYTTTDPSKLRIHSSGLRNSFGIGFDGDNTLWITENEDQGSGPEGSTLGDKVYQGAENADYGFLQQNASIDFRNDATVQGAGFFLPANSVAPTADLGAHAAAGGIDFSMANDLPLVWHKHAFVPRWVFNDVVAIDRNTGEVTTVLSNATRALETVRDPLGNILIGEAPNDSTGTNGAIYRLTAASPHVGAHKFGWTATAGNNVWSDRFNWDADFNGDGTVDGPFSIDPNDKLVPHQWGTQRYDVTVNTSLGFTVTVDQDVLIESLTLGETLSIDSMRTLDVTDQMTILSTGILAGTGALSIGGGFAPADGTDTAPFGGDVTFGTDAALQLNIGGANAGEYDVLDLSGIASLDGVIEITITGGFTPNFSDTFEILTAGTVTDEFSGVVVTNSPGLFFDATYSANSVVLEILTGAPGDVNLDGIVNGDGSGLPEDDDVSAFIAGWLNEEETAGIVSWQLGDLNQDAITDLFDWTILRANHPNGPSLSLSALLGVPEPSILVFLLTGGLVCLCRRKQAF